MNLTTAASRAAAIKSWEAARTRSVTFATASKHLLIRFTSVYSIGQQVAWFPRNKTIAARNI
nr:MAG TPA: hypothetical protein [Caudoviricetes sp.]